MIAKLMGAVLVVAATSAAGWQVAGRYTRRPRELRDLQTGLAVLQTEVEYGATPLPEALASAGRAGGDAVGRIFASAATRLREGGGITAGEALAGAVDEAGPGTALALADREVLAALGPALGASGRQDQARHIAMARERLSAQEVRARDERDRYERLARYAGVLSGVALALILF